MRGPIDRRDFLRLSGLAATSGLIGLGCSGSRPAGAGVPAGRTAPRSAPAGVDDPPSVWDPVEVTGAEADPILGRLPGARRMYVLPAEAGEHHLIGALVMTRAARPADTGNVYELMMFSGRAGAAMPRHLHRASHAALLVLGGDVELELDGRTWRMLRGDFANIPPGTAHGWTMRSDRAKLALYTMNDRVGQAFVAMGVPQASAAPPVGAAPVIDGDSLAAAAFEGDFMRVPVPPPVGEAARPTNKVLPTTPGAYVIADGGGERYGGNVFLARNQNTTGNFLFIMTEGGPGGGPPPHFHARHFENFLGVDGETVGWAHGRAASLRTGDYYQAPPRHLHTFRLAQQYNRFAAFLTPGIFERFFLGFGGGGGRPAGAPAGAPPGVPSGGGGDMFRMLQMSARGPDGYTLDVHGPTRPLPRQDPLWTRNVSQADVIRAREMLLAHVQMLNGTLPTGHGHGMTPELERALTFKPRAEDLI